MSVPRCSDIQYHTDQVLMSGVLNPAGKEYFSNLGWTAKETKEHVYACSLWRMAVEARDLASEKRLLQAFVSALTAGKGGLKSFVLNRVEVTEEMAAFLHKNNRQLRIDTGTKCLEGPEFANFNPEGKDIELSKADIKGCEYEVKYICPKGPIVLFENKILYLLPRTVRKEEKQQFFFPSIKPKNATDLQRQKKLKKDLPWDNIDIKSVAMAICFRSADKSYLFRDNIVYVELSMSAETTKACHEVGGNGVLTIIAKSNLEKYAPKDRWIKYKKDIEDKLKEFDKINMELLSPDAMTDKAKTLREAYERLHEYFTNPKNSVKITSFAAEIPQKVGPQPNAGGDIDMSDGGTGESDGEL